MDPQKQKQFITQMLEATAKSQEELEKMTPEEKSEYLAGRLRQKMFFSTAQRQSAFQKKQLQEKMQSKLEEKTQQTTSVDSAKKERNRKKNQKRREKLRALKKEQSDLGNAPENESSESDYHSDAEEVN